MFVDKLGEIKAIGFDIDGTLYRTWKLNIRVWPHVLCHLNFFLNYRCFDFFLPRYGVGIELDSHYHDGTENNDTRSDLYVYQNYGVNVLRIRLASETHKEKDLDKLRKFFHTHKPLETNFPLDFSEIIASEFRTKYEKEIKELESMENQFSCGIYIGNLIITKEQEKLLKPVLRILDISYNIWI